MSQHDPDQTGIPVLLKVLQPSLQSSYGTVLRSLKYIYPSFNQMLGSVLSFPWAVKIQHGEDTFTHGISGHHLVFLSYIDSSVMLQLLLFYFFGEHVYIYTHTCRTHVYTLWQLHIAMENYHFGMFYLFWMF